LYFSPPSRIIEEEIPQKKQYRRKSNTAEKAIPQKKQYRRTTRL
jgi:hypothetical protein